MTLQEDKKEEDEDKEERVLVLPFSREEGGFSKTCLSSPRIPKNLLGCETLKYLCKSYFEIHQTIFQSSRSSIKYVLVYVRMSSIVIQSGINSSSVILLNVRLWEVCLYHSQAESKISWTVS